MDDLNQQKEKLFQLIDSWDENNIELALQITKGSPALLKAVRQRYMPIVRLVGGRFLKNLLQVPQKIANIRLDKHNILEYDESLIPVFNNLPCRVIYCYYKDIEELPWWLFEIQSLSFLDLSGQSVRELPEAIGNLTQLRTLRANRNALESIPATIGNLVLLEKLQLDFNHLKEVPSTIGNLQKLEWLCLEANNIEQLPASIQYLERISWLSIERTPLGKRHGVRGGRYVSQRSKLIRAIIADAKQV